MRLEELIKVLIASLPGVPVGIFFTLAICIYFLLNPEKLEKLASIFFNIISKVNVRWEYGKLASEIQYQINYASKQIEKEAPDILPYAPKIEWVKKEEEEAFLKRGEIIVRLKRGVNHERNLVMATLLYLSKGLLPKSRSYIDKNLMKSIEFTVAKRIFAKTRPSTVFDYFTDEILLPAFREEPALEKDCQQLEILEDVGYFTRILLVELKELGKRLAPALPTKHIFQEIRAFVNFLCTIVQKRKEEDVRLLFPGTRLKVGVILVAKKQTIQKWGIEAHKRRIAKYIREGVDVIYICGWGKHNVQRVKNIVKDMEKNEQIKVLMKSTYIIPRFEGMDNKGIVLLCQSNKSYWEKQRQIEEPVREAFERFVPEIIEGKVELKGIARKEGVGSKVAVYALEDIDAVRCCLGPNRERLEKIREALKGEWVGVIKWSLDPEEFIINSLYPLRRWDILDMFLDEEMLEARILVKDLVAYRRALGSNGTNVTLAEQLTGWKISLNYSS